MSGGRYHGDGLATMAGILVGVVVVGIVFVFGSMVWMIHQAKPVWEQQRQDYIAARQLATSGRCAEAWAFVASRPMVDERMVLRLCGKPRVAIRTGSEALGGTQ